MRCVGTLCNHTHLVNIPKLAIATPFAEPQNPMINKPAHVLLFLCHDLRYAWGVGVVDGCI